MEIKFVIKCLNYRGIDFSLSNYRYSNQCEFTNIQEDVRMFNTYPEAEEKIKSLEQGIYQIDKIFIKQ